MVSLDEYLSRHPADAPYLLKIDIDGYEMNVLRGAGYLKVALVGLESRDTP